MTNRELADEYEAKGFIDIDRYHDEFAIIIAALRQSEGNAAGDIGVTVLPDGSAFAVASYPLPKNHWLTAPRVYEVGRDDDVPLPALADEQRHAVSVAVKWAIRGATDCGKLQDFDPDALVQNAVYALCGPYGLTNAAGQVLDHIANADKMVNKLADLPTADWSPYRAEILAALGVSRLVIGQFTLRQSDTHPDKVWIFTDGGEGGIFDSHKLADVLGDFYAENF
jgi:hypothetical protein